MKRFFFLMALAAIPVLARAQGTEVDEGSDIRARVSAEIDKKLVKGFHLQAGAEGRFKDNLQGFNDFRLSGGATYKFAPWLKGGVGYTFIGDMNKKSVLQYRHRVHADLTGSVRLGDWRFAVRERIQLTHKTEDINVYQEARNALALKSRLKVSWKGSKTLEPYVYTELRHALNDPSFSATYNKATSSYSNVSFLGYDDSYCNRFRASAGLVWRVSKQNDIEFYGLWDRYRNKDIDTDREGSPTWLTEGLVLKSLTYKTGMYWTVGVAYRYSF